MGDLRLSGSSRTVWIATLLAGCLGAVLLSAQVLAPTLGARMDLAARPGAQVTRHANYAMMQHRAASGTEVRDYVTPAGVLFGVAWQGPRMPEMRTLLGARFNAYQQAASQPRRRRGPLYVKVGALVVENSGHMRDFHGRAYLADGIPAGVTAAEIR